MPLIHFHSTAFTQAIKVTRLKIQTFILYTIAYKETMGNNSGLQFKVAYWPAWAVGNAAQLAATHCPNKPN